MYIRVYNPILNRNICKCNLLYMWDGVVVNTLGPKIKQHREHPQHQHQQHLSDLKKLGWVPGESLSKNK